jgi:hypothetical protein
MNIEGVAVNDAGLSDKIIGGGHARQQQKRKHGGDSTHFFDLGANGYRKLRGEKASSCSATKSCNKAAPKYEVASTRRLASGVPA